EAQLDRFMFKIVVGYNTKEEEFEIAKRVTSTQSISLNKVLDKETLSLIKEEIAKVHIDEELEKYIVDIVCATREPKEYGLEEIADYIQFGASPRATIDMFKAVKAMAYIRGNDYVSPIDIALVVKAILRHRIILSYEAEAMQKTTDELIQKIMEKIDIP
ncbi:AAA family ATPase, partial [Arcobacter cloacae]